MSAHTAQPEVSVVIVLYNSAGTLSECLQSIASEVRSGFAEVIAVDNDSPDDSGAILQRELPAARLIRATRNLGFASGVNAAFGEARGRFWLVLNPDVQVPPGGLTTLTRFLVQNPQLGVASPDLRGADGHWESPGRAFPSIARVVLETTRAHRLLSSALRGRLLRGPYWSGGDQLDAGWVPGTALIVRPEVVAEAGPMREDLFMYGEDIEWCWRIRRRGWAIGVCAGVTFKHATSSSVRKSWDEDQRERRIAEGVNAACRVMYGPLHARLLAHLTSMALMVEARTPRRSRQHRARAYAAAKAWNHLARSG